MASFSPPPPPEPLREASGRLTQMFWHEVTERDDAALHPASENSEQSAGDSATAGSGN